MLRQQAVVAADIERGLGQARERNQLAVIVYHSWLVASCVEEGTAHWAEWESRPVERDWQPLGVASPRRPCVNFLPPSSSPSIPCEFL